MHGIGNLALLSIANNAELSNAVFEVKRRKIKEIEQRGDFIPICTRRVFIKHYNADEETAMQYYFWSAKDRENYINEILNVLDEYLAKELQPQESEDLSDD